MGKRFDEVFRISIILKGLDATAEVIGGLFLLFVTPHDIQQAVHWLTGKELAEDPHDFIATILNHSAHHIAAGTTIYAAIYLFSHGVIKLFVIINVLRNKYWAYPLLIVTLFGFVVYQAIEIFKTYSIFLILLSVFDIFIIVLTWFEWQKQRELRHKAEAAKEHAK